MSHEEELHMLAVCTTCWPAVTWTPGDFEECPKCKGMWQLRSYSTSEGGFIVPAMPPRRAV